MPQAVDQKKSGFHECWSHVSRTNYQVDGPFVFDIWNFRKASKLMDSGTYLASDITEEDVSPSSKDSNGYSNTERQWEQVLAIKSKSREPAVRLHELHHEMKTWKYPLSLIHI